LTKVGSAVSGFHLGCTHKWHIPWPGEQGDCSPYGHQQKRHVEPEGRADLWAIFTCI